MRILIATTVAIAACAAATGTFAQIPSCAEPARAQMPAMPRDVVDPAMLKRPGAMLRTSGALAQSGQPMPDHPIPPTVEVKLQGAVHGFVLPEQPPPPPRFVESAEGSCAGR